MCCGFSSAADGAAGGLDSPADQQPAELFPAGAAEPQRGAAAVRHRHRGQPVALHARQTLETDSVSLTDRHISKDRQADTHTDDTAPVPH